MKYALTERAQNVTTNAAEEAKRLKHDFVGTEHILLALIAPNDGVACKVLASLQINFCKIKSEIEKIIGIGCDDLAILGKELPFTPRAKAVLHFAVQESQNMEFDYIGTEHILLGIFKENEGIAFRVLENMGLTYDIVRNKIIEILKTSNDVSDVDLSSKNKYSPEMAKYFYTEYTFVAEYVNELSKINDKIIDNGTMLKILEPAMDILLTYQRSKHDVFKKLFSENK